MLRLVRAHEDLADGAPLSRALAELDAEVRRCGLTPGCPPYLTAGAAGIDVETCAAMCCGECGAAGGEWYPAHETGRGRPRYIAFFVCGRCGNWEQI
jgi:hypothetical protein